MKTFYRWIVLAGFLSTAFGQGRMMMQRDRTYGEPVYCEIHTIMTGSDSANVYILYKFSKDIFSFSRPIDNPTAPFSGSADIAVEVLDSAGNSVTRSIRELKMETENNSDEYLKKQYSEGLTSFRLPYGRYTALLQITDRESHIHLPDVRRAITIRKKDSPVLSGIIAVQQQRMDDSSYECFNLGGDILFSQDCNFIFVMKTNSKPVIQYSLFKRSMEDDEDREPVVKDSSIDCEFYPGVLPSFSEKNNHISVSLLTNDQYATVVVPFHSVDLKQGMYGLKIKADTATIVSRFRTRWLDMPMMLTNFDLALQPLQFIMSEEDYSELQSGSRENRIKKFDEFWAKKDPTPKTAYNEMLAEFYKRADYAMTAFRTLKEYNGTLTDRGKIFILYGKPTKTDRYLKPGDVPKEVWTYSHLRKTFIFEDPSKQGNYKLAETK